MKIASAKLRQFKTWLENVATDIREATDIAPVYKMLEAVGYQDWLMTQSNTSRAGEKKWQNVELFCSTISGQLEKADSTPSSQSPLEAILHKMLLRDIMEQKKEDEQDDQVQLMTLHASKGLEYPCVYILGLEEQLLPHKSSLEEDTLEEERRLFYVGITRAQQQLTISLTQQRQQFGEKVDVEPSRFLEEIPEEDIQWLGEGVEQCPVQQQELGLSYLAQMRAALYTE